MQANELRRAFLRYFEERDHTVVPSSGLIPHHPTAPLFTNAGMNQFVPYFLGEEVPPYRRAASVQKSVRTPDIEIIGTTTRHLTFFEMLGNFSFGDYFKEGAIRYAWELSTEVLGLDGDRIWVTAYVDDDEAADIWRDAIGVAPDRIQRLGDEDNFWEMQKGQPGPCGPNSELYYDRGAEFGAEGGPAHGGEERYAEFWNLVFMQFNRERDGALVDLPSKNVDTGAGMERILALLQGTRSVFETDVFRPVVATAERLARRRYGDDERTDISLRIMADHSRAMAFLVSDGVWPSNEERGYVLRRIIRRAVRHAYLLGVEQPITPELVGTVVDVLGDAYPDLARNHDYVVGIVTREEERFRQTLRAGSVLLDEELDRIRPGGRLAGDVAFRLHDTFGFPLEVTEEIATERGVRVDVDGFDTAMAEQRRRAKEAAKEGGAAGVDVEVYRELLEQFGPTEFTGRVEPESKARVLAVVPRPGAPGDPGVESAGQVEIYLDRSPFYAESGGQIGDTGSITTDTGVAEVLDTTYALPELHRHVARIVEGEITPGQEATAAIDVARREKIRRNHTGTHILHWALREVLGEHVKQQGSLVHPDYLRFDFSHFGPVTVEELRAVEDLANREVLANEAVRSYETTKEYAEQVGAIAFFGDKYGEVVRVVEAGDHSVELCGGTHVRHVGDVGPVKVLSEESIGANMRRIFATTGWGTLEWMRAEEDLVNKAAELLRVPPGDVIPALQKRLEELRALRDELKALRREAAGTRAAELAESAVDGTVVARVDGTTRDELRELAIAVRDQGVRVVVLGGEPEGGGAALVAAVAKGSGLNASDLIADAARTVKGGGGRHAELAVAGGKDAARLDEALDQARAAAGLGPAQHA
jgi:alanyl-tRNA synthetase